MTTFPFVLVSGFAFIFSLGACVLASKNYRSSALTRRVRTLEADLLAMGNDITKLLTTMKSVNARLAMQNHRAKKVANESAQDESPEEFKARVRKQIALAKAGVKLNG